MRLSGSAVFIHLVWATWDRLPLLTGEVEHTAYRAIGAKCEDLGAEIIALGGIEDHVHLLIKAPVTVPIATLAKEVKGASSHLVTHTFIGRVFKWQGAYGAVSVSPHDVPKISSYINGQRQHHATGYILAEFEPLPTDKPPNEKPS